MRARAAQRHWRGSVVGDDIDIRDGGVIAVDTQTLRHAAARSAALSDRVGVATAPLGDASRRLALLGIDAGVAVSGIAHDVALLASLALRRADDLGDIARDLRAAADTYEVIELRARAALHASSHEALTAFEAQHPGAAARADRESVVRDLMVGAQLTDIDNGGVLLSPMLAGAFAPLLGLALSGVAVALPGAAQGAQALIRGLGTGIIPAGARLTGTATPVRLVETSASFGAAPPDDLADALGRIHQGDSARVRIETYVMPDGTQRYAVYLAGTRDFSSVTEGGDPWDMRSNLQLYFGQDAAAYEAVRAAMKDAGVPPGAQVSLYGHSQGGMIADWLAVEGGYDVPMLVTAGSPTEADVGDRTLSIQLRHTDDVVQSLAAGGSDARVGAAGSIVVERAGEPGVDLHDVSDAAHHLTAYVATAKMVDASADPRTSRMRAQLAELRGARSVTAVEYDASRVLPAAQARSDRVGRPQPVPGPSPSPPWGTMSPTARGGGGGT